MSVLIKGMEMPSKCGECFLRVGECKQRIYMEKRPPHCPLVEVPPHGDLIDRDALIKDGWLNLYKEVIRMGGYAIHELPLKNPSIPAVIEKENC